MLLRAPGCLALTAMLVVKLLISVGCDDPTPGPIGGLILIIRSFQATGDPALQAISSVEIQTARVELQHQSTQGGDSSFLVVDSHPRTIVIANNGQTDVFVAQYQVPPGFVSQIRIFPRSVTLHMKNGPDVSLGVPSSNVPSWEQSGWKLEPIDGNPWPITQDQLTGVRVLFHFDDRMLHNKGNGYKIKPTAPAERFEVNPPPDQPGVFVDQITVVFKRNVTVDDINRINGVIGASIIVAPELSTAYRMKLPASENLEEAFNYYSSQPEVQAVLPASEYGLHGDCTIINDGPTPSLSLANVLPAWQRLCIGDTVGSYKVRVAVIDTGVPLLHPDLWMNIGIAQFEIPANVRAILLDSTNDCDHDGVVSFFDLNFCPHSDSVKSLLPGDYGGLNGVIDATDLIDSRNPWRDNDDNDGSGEKDDFVGWNFADHNANANDSSEGIQHGTKVAGIIGAIGGNGQGLAGAMWKVSLVPIRVNITTSRVVTDVHFHDSLLYAEKLHVDIVNISQGLTFASEAADLSCSVPEHEQLIKKIDLELFAQGRINHLEAFRMEPWYDVDNHTLTSQTLYIGSAGNVGVNLGSFDIREYPIQGMKEALLTNVMIIGSLQAQGGIPLNCSDSSYGTAVDLFAGGQGPRFLNAAGGVDSGLLTCQTSYAAPVVSGAAALVLTAHPELRGNPTAIRQRLLDNARRPPAEGASFQNFCHLNEMPVPPPSLPMVNIATSTQ